MLKKINVLWQASLIEWPGQTFQAPTNINIGQITDLPSKPIWSYGTSNPVEGKSPVQKGKIGQIAQPMHRKSGPQLILQLFKVNWGQWEDDSALSNEEQSKQNLKLGTGNLC